MTRITIKKTDPGLDLVSPLAIILTFAFLWNGSP